MPLLLVLSCVDYGVTRKLERETWVQPERENGVDILWVVDDSLSMLEEQEQLAAHADSFISFLTNVPVDFRLGVTTTDMDEVAGALVGPPLDPDTQGLAQAFAMQVTARTEGSRDERGFDAAAIAANAPDFGRAAADLEVVFFTDEDDQSELNVDQLLERLGQGRRGEVVVNVIAGDLPEGCASLLAAADPGEKLAEVAEASGGLKESICSSDYAALLERVAMAVLGMDDHFQLAKLPELDTMEVRVDGVLVHHRDRHGWRYEAGDNMLVLDGYAVPPPGSTLDVRYYEWYGLAEELDAETSP